MNIQKKLYATTERKLVAWCIAAMLFMSVSVIVPAYLVTTNWLGHSSATLETSHRQLLGALIVVQLVVIAIGTSLSFVFAKKALRPIRRAHQAQADFAANAHHQLRTPITIMQAEVDTALVRKDQTPDDYRIVFESIRQELHLLRATSENLLLLADDAMSDTLSDAEDAAEVVASLQRRYHIHIHVTNSHVFLPLSREELLTIFETLLDNTVKHAGIARKDIRVNVALRSGRDAAVIEYNDNGKGIAGGEEKRLFERTFRGSRAVSGGVPGGGLGLAIVAEVVRTHNGRIKAGNMSARGGFRLVLRFPKNSKR